MEILKNIIKCIISIAINMIIYIISFLIPKSDDIWLFGGWFGKRFADNSRYLYLYCNEFQEVLNLKKIIWITENYEIYKELKEKGLEVYKKWSFRSIWYHLRSGIVFVDQGPDDVNKYFCIGSIKVNVWHGFPLKKIGLLSKNINFNMENIYNKYLKLGGWSNYYLQGTSNLSKDILGKAFGINKDKVIIGGYPRMDVFTTDYWRKYLTTQEVKVINEIQNYKRDGYKIIFYLPTFRDNKDIEFLNIKNSEENSKLVNFLIENKIILVTKFHFAQDEYKLKNSIEDNILNLESNMDVYAILSDTDILITDYSSVYFDFLITNRPVIFYPFDLDYYSDESLERGLIFDYNEFTPGPKAFNLNELLYNIKDVIDNTEKYKQRYEEQYNDIKNKVFEDNYLDGTEKLLNQIKSIL